MRAARAEAMRNLHASSRHDPARQVWAGYALVSPIAYFGLDNWLQTFPYRFELGVSPFAAIGVASIGLALVTVGYQTFRASVANPIDALRAE